MRKRARVIYNPTSGHEILKGKMIDILNVIEKAGYEASAYPTNPTPLSAQKEATRAVKEGFDLIVAAGGDGTINEVLNGIAGLPRRPKMAIIPGGTTNDFARALHIPRDNPVDSAKIILKHQTLKIDVGKANRKYFINIAGGGLLTELTYDVPSELKSIFGYLAYLVRGAEMLPRIKPIDMDLKYDGGHFKGKASMFLLAMTNSIGGLEQIVPDASLDDGQFTMIIVKASNLVQIMQLLAKVINGGKHIDDPRIIYKKTKTLVASPVNDPMQINLDGEYGGDAPMTFKNLKQHIEIYANVDAIPDTAINDSGVVEAEKEFVEKVDKLPQK